MSQKKLAIFLSIFKEFPGKIESHYLKKAELNFDTNFSKERQEILESFKNYYEEYKRYDPENLQKEKLPLQNHVLSEKLKKSTIIMSTPFIIALMSIVFPILVSAVFHIVDYYRPFTAAPLENPDPQGFIISLSNQLMDLGLNGVQLIIAGFFISFLILYALSSCRVEKINANILVLERRLVIINELISNKNFLG